MELREMAEVLYKSGMRCNCDLDNWMPEASTGHSHVCRIHKTTMVAKYRPYDLSSEHKVLLNVCEGTEQ